MVYKMRDFICEYCGKPFKKRMPPTQEFCGPTCRNKARILREIPCPICGTMFRPRIVSYNTNGNPIRKQTCSGKCGSKLHGKMLREKGHWNAIPQEEVNRICELYLTHTVSEVADIVRRSIISTTGIITTYCPNLCETEARRRQVEGARKWMLENNPRDEVALRKWRETHPAEIRRIATLASRSNQRKHPSGLERKLYGILDSLDVSYERQVVIKDNFIVDVQIGNLILEADGDYWHGHPRFNPFTDRQKAQQRRDKARNAYLTACGYVMERIWGSDIKLETIKAILKEHSVLPCE